ncbi:MAG: hypothetical protein GC162_05520 [Planctomycetes bacterium]|nr:hypothetical protein [Planctomycetota bacterium]
MAPKRSIFDLIEHVAHPVVDHAIAGALSSASEADVPRLVHLLLERRHEAAQIGLVRCFDRFKPELQRLVVDHVPQLDSVLRAAASDADVTTRLNAVQLIARSGSLRLAYLLAAQLHADDARLTRAGAAGLLDLSQLLAAGPPPETHGAAAPTPMRRVAWMTLALAEACACYQRHGRHDVLTAVALLAPRRSSHLLAHFKDVHAPAHIGLSKMLRHPDSAPIAHAMLSFAATEELMPAVAEGLRLRAIVPYLDRVIAQSHLLAARPIRSAIRKVAQCDHLLPDAEMVDGFPAPVLRNVPRWVRCLNTRTESKIKAMDPLMHSADRVTRMLVLRALIKMHKIQADDAIANMCFDGEPVIARIALRHLIARRWSGLNDLLVRLITSPHHDVATLAESQFQPVGFARFWEHWDQLAPSVRLAAGRALMKIDAHFHHQLAARMASDRADDRFRAVMVARHLSQESYFENQLVQLVHDPVSRIASTAAAALGHVPASSKAVTRLTEALEHPDDRVRANAVESLQQLDAVEDARASLIQLTDGEGNRSRANAIKALMELPVINALPALRRMLADTDARHRISALWVVEQMGIDQVAYDVASMAQHDADPNVRRRAVNVFRRMAQDHLNPAPARADAPTQEASS